MKKTFHPESIIGGLPGIIILSHGPLAGALIESMKLIYGETDNLASLELQEGDSTEEFYEEIATVYEAMPPNSVFLIDLFGGSPFNQVTLYGLKKGIQLKAITGVNLGMLLEAVSLRNAGGDFSEKLEQIGKDGVMDVAKAMKELS